MNKNKGEKAYLVIFPTDKDGGKALDLLCAEGRVYGVLYQGIPTTVVTESQLKRLDRAGIRWQFVKPAMNKKEQQKKKGKTRARG